MPPGDTYATAIDAGSAYALAGTFPANYADDYPNSPPEGGLFGYADMVYRLTAPATATLVITNSPGSAFSAIVMDANRSFMDAAHDGKPAIVRRDPGGWLGGGRRAGGVARGGGWVGAGRAPAHTLSLSCAACFTPRRPTCVRACSVAKGAQLFLVLDFSPKWVGTSFAISLLPTR